MTHEIFAKVLNYPSVPPHTNFFEVGGDSLAGSQVAVRIEEELHCKVPLQMLLDNPTPVTLAAQLAESSYNLDEPIPLAGVTTNTLYQFF